MDKVLIIDAHNAIWRACVFFKKPETYSQAAGNEPSEEFVFIYNFFKNLRPLIELFSPDKCFFVLEGHPQFRYDLFPEYKANRIIKQASKQETMNEFHKTKNEIIRLIHYLPITVCRSNDYEADDVVATLCENLKEEHVTVLSSDSDYIQLLQRGYSNCQIYNPIKKTFMKSPSYPYVAWKCLVGDTSDNIPGFAGIGDKRAQKLLSDPDLFMEFMSVEENRANFSIYRQLIEFRPVPMEEISLSEGTKNFKSLRYEFSKMKFETITNNKSWEKYCKTFECIKY